jgi:hypothetical protein
MEDAELVKLFKDTEALLQRWKKAASEMAGDNLQVGQMMVNQVFAANVVFHKMYEELRNDYLAEGMDIEFF